MSRAGDISVPSLRTAQNALASVERPYAIQSGSHQPLALTSSVSFLFTDKD